MRVKCRGRGFEEASAEELGIAVDLIPGGRGWRRAKLVLIRLRWTVAV
jgi:hypothetical protein